MKYDLHTHSTASDGSLTPSALLGLARERGVDVISITDHDTLSAYADLTVDSAQEPTVIPGIELSTSWAGRGIHVVGLNIDIDNATLRAGITNQQRVRQERAQMIVTRLRKLGIDISLQAVQTIAGQAAIGRPHFAAHLVAIGVVKDTATAFRKYLGPGKPGDVRHLWAELEDVVRWIRSAGGCAVLAHPAKYKMTTTKLRLLLNDFVVAGGNGIEVICGQQQPHLTKRLAELAHDFELAASVGSDFHHPGNSWSQPGHIAALPKGLPTVWQSW